jgi:hypothetical protein
LACKISNTDFMFTPKLLLQHSCSNTTPAPDRTPNAADTA